MGKLVLAKEVEASLSVGADIKEGWCLQDQLVLINYKRRLVPSEPVSVGQLECWCTQSQLVLTVVNKRL